MSVRHPMGDKKPVARAIFRHLKIKKALGPFYRKNIFDRKWMPDTRWVS